MPHYLNYGAFRINVSIPSCVESSAGFICKIILGICGVLHSPKQSTISISAPTMKELGEDFNSDFTKYLYWFQGKYYLHNILLGIHRHEYWLFAFLEFSLNDTFSVLGRIEHTQLS